MSLYAKIAQVQAEMGGLKSDRTANVGQYRYDYITDSAIFAQVRKRLSPLGVATFVSVESEEQRGEMMTVVGVLITFADAESGEQFAIRSVGYGTDRADKGCGKAITSAVRYAFTKTFLQGGDEDPEQEYIENTRVNGRARAPEQPVEPSPGGRTPHEIVHEGLAALDKEDRKRLKAHLVRMQIAPPDQRVTQGWLDAIVDNFSGDYENAPLYEQLPALLAALDEQLYEQRPAEKREPDFTPLERRDADDARRDAESEELFGERGTGVQQIPMYGEKAPS